MTRKHLGRTKNARGSAEKKHSGEQKRCNQDFHANLFMFFLFFLPHPPSVSSF